jgi:tape measure domain-containing protein
MSNDAQVNVTYTASGSIKPKDADSAKSAIDAAGLSATKFGTVAGIAGSLAGAAFSGVKSLVGDMITRMDTLDNANKAFRNMGLSASQTESVMSGLDKAVTGLPTSMSDAVGSAQLLASSMLGVKDAGTRVPAVFKALNDGILGFGGSADQVKQTTVQLSQAFANGKIDGQTWMSLMNGQLGPALNAIATKMHMSMGQLKAGLSDGSISVKSFQDALVDLDKNGGGGIKSLSSIAADSTKGFATSLKNAKTAIVNLGSSIGESLKPMVVNALNNFTNLLKGSIPAITAFFKNLVQSISKILDANVFQAMISGVVAFGNIVLSVVPNVIGIFGKVFGVLASLAGNGIFQGVIAGVATFAGALGAGALVMAGFAKAIALAASAVNGLKTIIGGLKAGMDLIASHPIIAVLAALVGVFVALYNSSAPFKQAVDSLAASFMAFVSSIDWSGFSAIVQEAFTSIGSVMGGLVAWVIANWPAISATASTVFNTIVSIVQNVVIPALTFLWQNILAPIVSWISANWPTISAVMGAVFSVVGAVISGAISVMQRLLSVAGSVVSGVVGFFNSMASGISAVFGRITSIINGIKNAIGSVGSAVGKVLGFGLELPVTFNGQPVGSSGFALSATDALLGQAQSAQNVSKTLNPDLSAASQNLQINNQIDNNLTIKMGSVEMRQLTREIFNNAQQMKII